MMVLQSKLARRNRRWSGLLWNEGNDLWQKRLPLDPESSNETE
jgi:hypothetical protein